MSAIQFTQRRENFVKTTLNRYVADLNTVITIQTESGTEEMSFKDYIEHCAHNEHMRINSKIKLSNRMTCQLLLTGNLDQGAINKVSVVYSPSAEKKAEKPAILLLRAIHFGFKQRCLSSVFYVEASPEIAPLSTSTTASSAKRKTSPQPKNTFFAKIQTLWQRPLVKIITVGIVATLAYLFGKQFFNFVKGLFSRNGA